MPYLIIALHWFLRIVPRLGQRLLCAIGKQLLCSFLLVLPVLAWAQPPNNNWQNAIEIEIPDDNFGVGVIQSTIVNLTGANSQPGEYLQNPTYNKTVWYKFSVPSHRLVKVLVRQPTEIMQSTDAGFFVYNSTATIPGAAAMAIYTPMFSIASYSENVCLEQGEYYVQVIAKNSANSEIFVELDVDYTYPVSTSHAHDQVESAFNIGTLSANHSMNFSWNCLSIQTPKEYDSHYGADSINFTKSIWYRFTTDSHVDMYSFYVSYPTGALNGSPYTIRIFEGPVNTASMDTSQVVYKGIRTMTNSFHHLRCLLEPNKEYYVQILGRINYTGNSNLYIRHLGEGITTGAYPQEVGFNPLNDFGTVVPTPSPGTTMVRQDYFSCDALLTNDSIQCGTVNPPDAVTIGATTYDLTTWFTLDVTAPANVLLRTYVQNQYCNYQVYNHNMYIRIFNQTPDNDCDNLDVNTSLYYEGAFDANGAIVMNCLPAGEYSIQLLARSALTGDPYNCTNSQFGRRVNFAITLMGVPTTEYALLTNGDVDWINGGNALADNVLYTADSSSFSCEKTIIPDTAVCSNIVDRAMYRQIVIGDADNDLVPDSGMVTIDNYSYYNAIQNHLVKSVFYRGDAAELAQTQGITDWPDQIDGLDPQEGCNMYNAYFYTTNTPYNRKKFCVTPGVYTLAHVGDSTENGAIMAPRFRFTKSTTNHWDPNNAHNMGDIIAQGLNVLSPADTFSCRDNATTIAGLAPCNGYTKLIYREFYISEPCRITVTENSGTNSPSSQVRVFKGRVSTDGIGALTLAPYAGNNCYTTFSLPPCATVPEGWYTAVSYGYGPSYDNNYAFHESTTHNYSNGTQGLLYNIDYTSAIRVVADTTVPPGPFFNRPYKACVANNDNPLTWVNTGTTSVPSAATSYALCMERFKPIADTPFASIPILGCAGTVRVAFYVFTTDDEYYVRITGIDGYYKELHPLDVRTDSLLLPTSTPIAGCTNNGNIIEICRLQPGTYTLVVYGTPAQDCVTFTPTVHVQPVNISRFDFAQNAYDFGLVPGDGVYHVGSIGDAHPTDPSLLPSNDFFYCTTGAFATDPAGGCTNTVYPPIYPDHQNNAYYQENGTQTWYKRRNLWYTFVVEGMGHASIKIRNLTAPGNNVMFRMYRSNVEGNILFEDLLALGELDSILAMGLTEVHTNINPYYCTRSEESTYTFINDICEVDTTKRRYYIVAELDEYYISFPNVQMDLQVRWTPINSNPQDPKYDFYSQANVVGNNEDAPPYTDTALDYDVFYTGGWGNMSCATGDASDAIWSCTVAQGDQRSLWWKFRVEEPGFIHVAVESDATAASSFTRRLLQEIIPGDSIISTNGSTGLHSLGTGQNVGVTGSSLQWYRFCVEPGVYYYHVQRCADVDTSNVRAHVLFKPILGDNCINAPSATASTFGAYPLTIPILCQSMGDDFGEDGSSLGCLHGPTGYNSSWFKFSYTGTALADILFQVNLGSMSNYGSPDLVRYRLFYGSSCSTMLAGQECSINAYINNSIACVSGTEGDFYVQVVYPESTTGTLGFTFTVSPNSNPDCSPFNPTLMISDFFHQPNCTGDSIIFFNYATSGMSVDYLWDFGDGETSTEDNPIHAYAPGDYDVTLYVINTILNDTVSMTQTVTVSPTGSPLELGPDITICAGESAEIGQALVQATYQWSTGEATDHITVSSAGWYYLDIDYGGCPYSDSILVHVMDLSFDLGPDIFFCSGESATIHPTVPPGVDYLWSNGSTLDSLVVTQPGQYGLSISINNCIQQDSIMVDVLDLNFTLGNDTTICAGSTYVVNPIVANGVSYFWSDNSSASTLAVQNAGTYWLTIEQLGCSAVDTIDIAVLDLAFDLGNDTLFCVNQSVTLHPQVEPGVQYQWSTGETSSSIQVQTEEWVSLSIDKLGCSATDSLYVSELDLSFTLGNDTTICLGSSLLLQPTVLPGVSFAWSNGASTSSISVNTSGIYSLTIWRDGCIADDSIIVDVLDLTFNLGNDTTICNGASLLLQPVVLPGVSFDWSDGSTGNSITVSSAGIYSLEIDSLGCSAQDDIEVSLFYVNAVVPTPLEMCLNDTAYVMATGMDSLSWSNGLSSITMYSPTVFGLYPANNTTYNWTAYENGCTEMGSTEVLVIQPYIPTVTYDDEYCKNESQVILPVIAGTTGTYYLNGSVTTSLPISSLDAGNHVLEYYYVDNVNNCFWGINLPFTIHDTTALAFTSIPEICVDTTPFNLTTIVNVTGGQFQTSYNGSVPDVIVTQFDAGDIPTAVASPQNYPLHYEYTNAAGCMSETIGTIRVHPIPVASFSVADVCLNDTVQFTNTSTVNGSAITAYSWTIPGHANQSGELPVDVIYNVAGDYTIMLRATSSIGCEGVHTEDVTVHDLPVLTLPPYGPFCKNEGAILMPIATPAGGTWSNASGTVNNLNTYNLPTTSSLTYHFTDANGCSNQEQLLLVINDTTTLALNATALPICLNSAPIDLNNLINVTGGSWSAQYQAGTLDVAMPFDPSLIQNWDGLQPINVPLRYEFINADGCVSNLIHQITVHPLPVVDVQVPAVCAGIATVISNNSFANGSTTTATWTFDQLPNTNAWTPTGISYPQAGDYPYSVTITSAIGCEAIENGMLTVHPLPVPSMTWSGACLNDTILFYDMSTVASGSIVSQAWLFNNSLLGTGTSVEHVFTALGSYAIGLTVTTDQGCTAAITETLGILPTPNAVLQADDHCYQTPATLMAQYDPSTGVLSQSEWFINGQPSGAGTTLQHLFAAPGTYDVDVRLVNTNGCENTVSDTLRVHPLPVPSYQTIRYDLCLGDEEQFVGTSTVDAPYTVTQHNWQWSNGQQQSGISDWFYASPQGLVHLTLTATTNAGCSVSITENNVFHVRPLPFADFKFTPDTLSYDRPDLIVTDLSSGAETWQYTVSDGFNFNQASFSHRFMEDGNYSIEQLVINQYGCRDSITKHIHFKPGLLVYIPNAFTPDNDGINDVFYPVITGDDLTDYELVIWDRWGMEVFRSVNRNEAWTGNVNGGEHYAKDEVYNYRLIVRGKSSDKLTFEGFVTLLR
jgi:gliding motility-associated-like protein